MQGWNCSSCTGASMPMRGTLKRSEASVPLATAEQLWRDAARAPRAVLRASVEAFDKAAKAVRTNPRKRLSRLVIRGSGTPLGF